MIKKTALILLAATVLTSISAHANCDVRYDSILQLTKQSNNKETIKSTALTIAFFAVNPAALAVKVVAHAVSAKLTYDGIKGQMSAFELKKITALLHEAALGDGTELLSVQKTLSEMNIQLSTEQIAKELDKNNENMTFCSEEISAEDQMIHVRMATYSDILVSLGANREQLHESKNLYVINDKLFKKPVVLVMAPVEERSTVYVPDPRDEQPQTQQN